MRAACVLASWSLNNRSISSTVLPAVSGITNLAQQKHPTQLAANTINVPNLILLNMAGVANATAKLHSQLTPKIMPMACERCWLGNISEEMTLQLIAVIP